MNTCRIIYSRTALRDLNSIAGYLEAEAGSRVAARWTKLRARIRGLGATPKMGQRAEEFGAGRRRLGENPYVIVYEIHEQVIEVVRVLHGARDLPSLFPSSKAD